MFELEVTRLAREEGGHVLALLAHRFGDLDLADESVQDALLAAAQWQVVPANPPRLAVHRRPQSRGRPTATRGR